METRDPRDLVPTWVGLVDDAAIFPPGNAPLAEAVAEHTAPARRLVGRTWSAASCSATPTSPQVAGTDARLVRGRHRRRRSGGRRRSASPAGSGWTWPGSRSPLRDLDDLAGNARRVVAAVDAARAEGVLDEDTPVHVELPRAEVSASWLAAADEVAGAELRLKFRTGGTDADRLPVRRRGRRLGRRRARPRGCRSSAPPACTRRSGTATRRPASSTTASSTCWSPPSTCSTAPSAGDATAIVDEADVADPRHDGLRHRPGERATVVHVVRLLLA